MTDSARSRLADVARTRPLKDRASIASGGFALAVAGVVLVVVAVVTLSAGAMTR